VLLRFDSPVFGSDFILDVGQWVTPSISRGGMITAQIRKSAAASVSLSAGLGIDVTGAKSARRFDDPQAGLAWIFDEPTKVTDSGVASISGGGQIICQGQGGQQAGTITITAGAGITAAIRKDAIGEWFTEFWVNLTASVEKGAQAQPVVAGGGAVVASGTKGTRATVKAGGVVSAVPQKNARVRAIDTGAGALSATGVAAGPPHLAVVSGGGTVTATGTAGAAKLGTVILSGRGAITLAIQKIAAVLAAITIGGGVQGVVTADHTGTASISGGGSISVVPEDIGDAVGEIELEAVFASRVDLTALVRT